MLDSRSRKWTLMSSSTTTQGQPTRRTNLRIPRMKVVGFFNNKGGVGKTTLVCNLASIFSEKRGLRTLVIDCDPQCNATLLILGEQRAIDLYWSESGNARERRST